MIAAKLSIFLETRKEMEGKLPHHKLCLKLHFESKSIHFAFNRENHTLSIFACFKNNCQLPRNNEF